MNYSSVRKIKPKLRLQDQEVHQQESKPFHVLRHLFPWKTKEQFVDHLVANVIYNQGTCDHVCFYYCIKHDLFQFRRIDSHQQTIWSATYEKRVNNWSQ